MKEIIEAEIRAYIADETRAKDVREQVAALHLLPCTMGWDDWIGISPEGVLHLVDYYVYSSTPMPDTDVWPRHIALAALVERYPALQELAPRRTADSETCRTCRGTGLVKPMIKGVICMCGGLGWLPARAPAKPNPNG